MQNFVGKTKCIAGYMKVANSGFVHFKGVHLGFLSHLGCSAKKAIASTQLWV